MSGICAGGWTTCGSLYWLDVRGSFFVSFFFFPGVPIYDGNELRILETVVECLAHPKLPWQRWSSLYPKLLFQYMEQQVVAAKV